MPDYIGNIVVPEIVPSGVFPLVPDYPHGRAQAHEVVVHQFGSGNAKIEQRFLLGTGAKRFTVRRAWLRDPDRIALRNFWETKYGPYGAFTYNAPNDDGLGTTAYTCRFANEPLSWEMLTDAVCALGVTLIEIPSSSPAYTLNQTVARFPPQTLKDALLSQVQQIIPLVKIQPLEPGYPAIHLSDRRCTVGGQLYRERLLEFDGISQGMGNEADEAQFSFGNADRVMRDLANDVDLYRAALEFSLFHVGTGIKVDLWRGEIVNWACDAGPEFRVTAADGLYELNLPYPTRKISRTCWKPFKSQACPYSTGGALDLVHFPNADASKCDKGYETENGCLAHGMKRYYGGILAEPQSVRIKDNSTGTWGFGRSPLTSVSLVADSIYDQVLPEIYTDSAMPVNCKIAAGRDESDFYEALGIVGEGPLVAFGSGHKLDGQYHHGYPGNFGLRQVLGSDPAGAQDWFSLDHSGNQTGGDWRKVFAGNSTYKDNFAAGTAFLVIRRSDAKGLQLSRPGEHQMEAVVSLGMKGWVWTSPGVRVWGPPLTNPVWIAINMLLRARGIRLGESATTQQLDLAETFFDVNAAIAAASICDELVSKLVGTGTELQFKFRGVIQEEKPLRDWLQEVLMNCLGYYTFAFGKLKIGVRVNSSTVEAFTEGNILFRSLQLAPLKPSFNHLTANFADEDFEFVANSVAVYDIDHANLIGGGAGPLFLKSSVNLSGSSSKSQVGRIVAARLREELGGITADEWKKARQVAFKTTVLALNTEPGMVCSMTHPDMPSGSGEFRVTSWRLNRDYSIDIQGRTTTDSMYDLVSGPKPADVVPDQVPEEILIDTGVPGVLTGTPRLGDYGTFAMDDMSVAPDASGNSNIVGAHEITLALYYVDELTTDLWASIDTDMDAATDPATVSCTVNPDTSRVFRVGDFVVLNDESADPNNPGRRSYECAQIVGPGTTGDVVPTGDFVFQRAYTGVPEGQATFGTMRSAHLAGIRVYKLDQKTFTFSVRKGFFRTPGLPARIEAKLPSACLVAALAGVANHFGYGPFTVFPLSRHNEPYMPGLRTCNGGAYTFQVPGPLSVQENVVIPLKVQDAASIRCIYAYLQQGTTDGQSAFLVKISRDDGATWEPLEYMGIAQALPDAYKNTYDFLVNNEGYGLPASRRLPYADYGLALAQAATANPAPQTLQTASYGANRLGLAAGQFLFLDPGGANEEYVKVITADPDNQTFDAIVTKDHADGERLRPSIWPTPVLLEGDDLAFDILAVAAPDAGSDLTVVIQT
ncbi:hypothetical protein [uncultured Paludibaculum sp.]|uniref:hypothetical protein n=1 Tax=uncultured Paludibaculum sp. TaxID=1765020 RepID=UPI002AAB867E|nr:hypothetical protein [uncultured Paludibaculum sp.]